MASPYVKMYERKGRKIVEFHRNVGKAVVRCFSADVTGLTDEELKVLIPAELEAVRALYAQQPVPKVPHLE